MSIKTNQDGFWSISRLSSVDTPRRFTAQDNPEVLWVGGSGGWGVQLGTPELRV